MFVVTVSSSSKKAGKSALASYLVRELEADYGIKVSSGGEHDPANATVTDPDILSRPGTDTAALIEAGARTVVWVDAEKDRLAAEIKRVMGMLPEGALVIIEGNSALRYVEPDLAVFLMNVPFGEFKPSANVAISKADLVLVDMSEELKEEDPSQLEREILKRSEGATVFFFGGAQERKKAWELVVKRVQKNPETT